MEEFFRYFTNLDGKTVYEIIKDVIIPFFAIAMLITFCVTQILKKVLQFFRKKFGWQWISWRLYPPLAAMCGIAVVGISFLIYAKAASLWFIITFGILVGLLAIGFFEQFEVILNKLPFWQKLWLFIWRKLGLEELISESSIMAKKWKKLKDKEKEIADKEKEMAKKEKELEKRKKELAQEITKEKVLLKKWQKELETMAQIEKGRKKNDIPY